MLLVCPLSNSSPNLSFNQTIILNVVVVVAVTIIVSPILSVDVQRTDRHQLTNLKLHRWLLAKDRLKLALSFLIQTMSVISCMFGVIRSSKPIHTENKDIYVILKHKHSERERENDRKKEI